MLDLCALRASQQPDQMGFTFHSENQQRSSLSYQHLDVRARSIAAVLQATLKPGDRAVLMYPAGLEYIQAFLGCLYAGVVAVPAYPPASERTMGRLDAVLHDAQARLILSTSATIKGLHSKHPQRLADPRCQWMATDQIPDEQAATYQRPLVRPDSLAFLQYTSGSTSAPKGVKLTHQNLLSNLKTIQDAFRLHQDSKGMIWLPPYHDMGLIGGILTPLFVGFEVHLMPPVAFLKKPESWLQHIANERATCSGGPNFAYELCVQKTTPEFRETLDLSCWEVAFCGAEPIRPAVLRQFSEAFLTSGFQEKALYPCYGLAEATLMVTGGDAREPWMSSTFNPEQLQQHQAVPDPQGRELVGCGQVREGLQVDILDPQTGLPLPEGKIGEIVVSGPSVSPGYWHKPPRAEAGFPTGDLGFLWQQELFVTGRIKEVLIVRGRNHYPQDIEATVQSSHAALEPGAGVAFTDEAGELVVVQEVRRSHRKTDLGGVLQDVREAVALEHQLQLRHLLLVPPGSLEKTSSGKLQRTLTRARFLQSEIVALEGAKSLETPAAPQDPLSLQLMQLGPFAAHELQDDLSLLQLGLDSLKLMEFQHWLSARSEVSLEDLLAGMSIREIRQQLKNPAENQPAVALTSPETSAPFPLSPEQRQFWLLDAFLQSHQATHASHITARIALEGPWTPNLLQGRLTQLVFSHPVLRTSYHLAASGPLQQLEAPYTPDLPLLDLQNLQADQQERVMAKVLEGLSEDPIDLTGPCMLRAMLFQCGHERFELGVTLHHIAGDYFSLEVLLQGLLNQTPTAASYQEHVQHQQPPTAGHLQYWETQFAGARPAVAFPDPLSAVDRLSRHTEVLPWSRWEQVKKHARAQQMTPFMVLLSAYHLALHQHSRAEQVMTGVVVSGRRGNWQHTAGCFVNVLPVRSHWSGQIPAERFGSEMRQTVLAGLKHLLPYEVLLPGLREADRNATPLNAGFVMQGLERIPEITRQNLTARLQGVVPASMTQQDLRLTVGETVHPEGVRLDWDCKWPLRKVVHELSVLFNQSLDALLNGETLELQPRTAENAPSQQKPTRTARDSLERVLQHLWQKVLGLPEVGIQDSFFELGGSSLQVVQLWTHLNGHFGVMLPQQVFFDGRLTIEKTAKVLRDLGIRVVEEPIFAPQTRSHQPEKPPRTLNAHQTLSLLLQQLQPSDLQHHVRLWEGPAVDPETLKGWVQEALEATPELHTVVDLNGARAVPAGVVAHQHSENKPENLTSWLEVQLHSPFDLQHPPLLRSFSASLPQGMLFGLVAHPLGLDEAALDVFAAQVSRRSRGLPLLEDSPQTDLPAGDGVPAELPASYARPARPHWKAAQRTFQWPHALRKLDAKTAFAAFQVLIYRLGGQENFWLSHQSRAVAVHITGQMSFVDLMQQEQKTLSNAGLWQQANLSGVPRQHPVCPLAFTAADPLWLGEGLLLERFAHMPHRLHDLRVQFTPEQLTLEYRTELFSEKAVQTLLDQYVCLLQGLTAFPERPVQDHPMGVAVVGQGEQRQVPQHHLLQAFQRQAMLNPHKVAVRSRQEDLSYSELDRQSSRLAHQLLQQGITPADRVGICLERSPQMLLALLAVLKSGAAYVPLDPRFPRDRLEYILQDAQLKALITSQPLQQEFQFPCEVLLLQGLADTLARQPDTAPALNCSGEDLAYLMYTSGSTGAPKGVMVNRAGLDNFLLSMQERPGLTEEDVLLAVTTLSFDIAGLELFLPLTVGATVLLASREEAMYGPALMELARTATVMQATPVTWRMLLDAGWTPEKPFKALIGGEALPAQLAAEILALGVELWNMYGPTETTIWSTLQRMLPEAPITLGQPILNTSLHVLDEQLRPVPAGAVGELWIGGLGVAKGYWNRPELTESRFVQQGEERLYCTGDLVRVQEGQLLYVGRSDHQLKVRGFRIEPGEIEAVLCRHPQVQQAVVLPVQVGGEIQLAAYLQTSTPISAVELRQHLGQFLPPHMVPAHFEFVQHFPLTPNGKVDRKQLKPTWIPAPLDTSPPTTPTEHSLHGVFSGLLGINPVGIHEDFFALGGDIHALLHLQQQAETLCGQRLNLSEALFEPLTIHHLGSRLDVQMLQDADPDLLAQLLGELDLS
ncbi:hypothetical protein GCM10008938_43470 [Deinococcus roseus]|uniref:Carrier domain-containing protein n=1 Tax=Deinococcus roseus TaxID=392414 RepID=A0ABQ2DBW8_9DEIO|nr:hypothetical protein GCM10008938_43470 [Deinococcus roseus]